MKIIELHKTIVAVDFDGTVVEHCYPRVGPDVCGAVETLHWLQDLGVRLILFTMRSGRQRREAVEWFETKGIKLWGVNRNPEQDAWTDSPKVYAHRYIDDAAVGCPLIRPDGRRPYVDWPAIRRLLDPAA